VGMVLPAECDVKGSSNEIYRWSVAFGSINVRRDCRKEIWTDLLVIGQFRDPFLSHFIHGVALWNIDLHWPIWQSSPTLNSPTYALKSGGMAHIFDLQVQRGYAPREKSLDDIGNLYEHSSPYLLFKEPISFFSSGGGFLDRFGLFFNLEHRKQSKQ